MDLTFVIENWEIISTVGLGVGGALYSAVTAWRTANRKHDEVERKAKSLDWIRICKEKVAWPDYYQMQAKNNNALALYAAASYDREMQNAIAETLNEKGIQTYQWEYKSSEGFLCYDPERKLLVVSIAGTNSADDLVLDAAVTSYTIDNIVKTEGIKIADDASGLRTTVGFATYAIQSHVGITRCLAKNGISFDDIDHKMITAHSLGSAGAYLLSLTEDFESAELYLYGCPKCIRWASMRGCEPHREIYSTKSLTDFVTMIPPQARLPKRTEIINIGEMRYPDGLGVYAPLGWIIQTVVVGSGLLVDILNATVLRFVEWKIPHSIVRSHSALGYALVTMDVSDIDD